MSVPASPRRHCRGRIEATHRPSGSVPRVPCLHGVTAVAALKQGVTADPDPAGLVSTASLPWPH